MPTRSLTQNPNDIVLNNQDEVDQILGNPPSWILRWGLSLVFIAVIIFGLIAWLIKYPDIVSAPINITTENPSIAVIAKSSGKLTQLFVENNQEVKENVIIGVLDNPTQLEDVQELEVFLENDFSIDEPLQYLDIEPLINLKLGSLQSSYSALTQKIDDYQYYLKQKGLFKKIQSFKTQIKHTKRLNENLEKQKEKLEKEISIAEKDVLRNRQLNQEGVIPDADLEKIETQFLQYQRQLDGMESQIVSNEMSIEQLQTQILDLSQNRKDGRSSREINIKENVERVKSEIEVWKKTYLIIAPISGKVSFSKIWNEQQFIKASEEVLTIVPIEGVGEIVGKALLPTANSGKVKPEQTVNIQLDGFPFQEFGVIKATVGGISLVPTSIVPNETNYILEINLPDSLVTTYDKLIPFRQEMKGTANIITEDRRVLERIFDRFNSVLKN